MSAPSPQTPADADPDCPAPGAPPSDAPSAPAPASASASASTAGAAVPPGGLGAAVWAALGVVYVVWGSTYLAIRVVVETMPPLLSGALRFGAAALLLGAGLAVRQGWRALRVTWPQFGSAFLVGALLLVGGNGLVVLAERTVPSGLAALMVASVPLWVVLLRRVFGVRTGGTTLAGVLLGLVGLVVLTAPGLTGEVGLSGLLLVVVAAVVWALGSVLAGRLPMPADPFVASVYEMLAGALGALALSFVRGEPGRFDPGAVSTGSWAGLVYLVLFGSIVAFTSYAWLLQRAPLTLVATYAYVNPVVAVFLGWLFLSEALTWPIMLGGAIVVGGVFLVARNER
ncbi:threonine/homoserine efflux transporter RhtA [Kitasatospora sp. SolWspMP-SS2h]|uniref:EamA family transporter n=1 Tax=Kitasatospora sp. SolWspMP-SS2h TaxID=1305729 RepID=UPI000DBA1845|nr:EamA family transporter [Kitasatospora sp. SolWspMP-SS2h]RAJ41761.1 threonine/homoserine efflux transporter RhtA [Kitasatospora sp. SolWspMP-SS2h]